MSYMNNRITLYIIYRLNEFGFNITYFNILNRLQDETRYNIKKSNFHMKIKFHNINLTCVANKEDNIDVVSC